MWWNKNSWPKRVPCLATVIEYIYLGKFHYCTHRILQRTVYTHVHPEQTVSVGLNGEAVFTFVDFIALSVHLSFQDVALNQALHNFLWRREQRRPLNKKEGAMPSGAQILSIDLQPLKTFCSSWQSSSKQRVRGATIAVITQTSSGDISVFGVRKQRYRVVCIGSCGWWGKNIKNMEL